MNLTHQFSDTELGQASLISKLSGRPHPVQDDVFAWNGKIIDRATAVVALLKVYNQVPVGDSVKMAMFEKYTKRFNTIRYCDFVVDVYSDDTRDPSTEARIWFNKICLAVKGDAAELPKETIKDILITLHS